MKTWDEFYANEIGIGQYLDKIADHKFYLEKIIELRPKRVLEVGCGPGIRSVFLSCLGIDCVALDSDKGIVDSVKRYNKKFHGKAGVVQGDAFKLPYKDQSFDIVFNAGFLEHFNDEEKKALVREFTRVAKYYIFMVPNKAHRLRPYGNEDLLTSDQWENILSEFTIIESQNIYRTWSNDKLRRITELFSLSIGKDIRENHMYYAKVSA